MGLVRGVSQIAAPPKVTIPNVAAQNFDIADFVIHSVWKFVLFLR